MNAFLHSLLGLPAPLALVVIAVLVFAESALFVGFVLPGETAVVLGGVLAGSHRISLTTLIVVVVLAAVLGDTVGYEIGRHLGSRVLRSRPLRRHQHRIDVARRSVRERGGAAVFLGRFTAFLRAVIPGLAGISRMPYRRFLTFNAEGAVIWGTGASLLGYFAGQSYAQVEQLLGRSGAILIGVFVIGGIFLWHRQRRGRAGSRAVREVRASCAVAHDRPRTGHRRHGRTGRMGSGAALVAACPPDGAPGR